jgi:hypothetical protein
VQDRVVGSFPGISFALRVTRLQHEGMRKVMSSHTFVESEEVKEQVDNKGHSLISCSVTADAVSP